MFKQLNNLSVGRRILLNSLVGIVLMAFIGGLAVMRLRDIDATVDDLADNFATDQHLADVMVAKILLSRFYANRYILLQEDTDLVRFHQEYDAFESVLKQADLQITNPERVKMLQKIKTGVEEYGDFFEIVRELLDKRNAKVKNVLNIEGPKIEGILNELKVNREINTSIQWTNSFSEILDALLLMRLNVFKFLQNGDEMWAIEYNRHKNKAFEVLGDLTEEKFSPDVMRKINIGRSSFQIYHEAFTELKRDAIKTGSIIKEKLSVIGPKVRIQASEMSDSVAVDFAQTNRATDELVRVTQIWLLVTLVFGISFKLITSLLLGRSITQPLVALTKIADQMTAGKIQEINQSQRKFLLSTIVSRKDELGKIGQVFLALGNYFGNVITDIVHVAEGLAQGKLDVAPKAEYRGDLIKIKDSLSIALLDLRSVIEDIEKASTAMAKGDSLIKPEAKYRGDFSRIQEALRSASNNLQNATTANEKQNWLRTGLAGLTESMQGDLELSVLNKKFLDSLVKNLKADVGMLYIIEDQDQDQDQGPIKILKLNSCYGFVPNLENKTGHNIEFKIGEGLVGQAALENSPIVKNQDFIDVVPTQQSGLVNFYPKHVVVIPFAYENHVKGVIELGKNQEFTSEDMEFLDLAMPALGISVNTAQSRERMAELLKESEIQSQDLKIKQEEVNLTNKELIERTKTLEEQQENIRVQNLDLQSAQNELIKKADELEQNSKYKSEFLANMSHELRTPLNSLLILAKNFADNNDGNLTEEQIEEANIIHSGGNDLMDLINEILDLSKVEAGKLDLDIDEVSIEKMIENLKMQFSPLADKSEHDFQIEIDSKLPPVIMGDEQRIQQVLKNFLSNAMKFTQKGLIKLKVFHPNPTEEIFLNDLKANDFIGFLVSDSGIGIPKEKQKAIFEAFQQADGSTSRDFGGTGLGLTISQKLVKLMDGKIELKSEEGIGSVFTFYLPLKTPNGIYEVLDCEQNSLVVLNGLNNSESEVDNSNSSKTILVVEDEPKSQKAINKLFDKKKIETTYVNSGEKAYLFLKEKNIDCMILDLGLADMNGMDLLRKIDSDKSIIKPPIVVFTARDLSLEEYKEIMKRSDSIVLKGSNASENLVAKVDLLLYSKISSMNIEEKKESVVTVKKDLSLKGKKILLVDDDIRNTYALSKILKGWGLNLIMADNGKLALKKLIEIENIDLVLMDIMMPVMDGYEAISKIRTMDDYIKTPIIAFTAKAMKEDREKCINVGANDYMSKPVNTDKLFSMLQSWVGKN